MNPVGVVLFLADGSRIPVETVYSHTKDGCKVFRITAVLHQPIVKATIERLPPNTAIEFGTNAHA